MKYTSAEAAKLLRKLNEEKTALELKEEKSSIFVAAVGEDVESVRPAYEYESMQAALIELDRKIRVVKHAINSFNIQQMVDGFDMTIDQMLVYIPQLTARKRKLSMMKDRLPKQREDADGYGRASSNVIDYSYANYDISVVEKECSVVADELSRAQTALDVVNNTKTMEIEL